MKITDLSIDRNEVQALETLSDNEAIEIVGGDRGGPSDGCPPMIGGGGFIQSGGEDGSYEFKGTKLLISISIQ